MTSLPKISNPNDPKLVLAYLKAGCEIEQIGRDLTFYGKQPTYSLKPPGQLWECSLKPEIVVALETLKLIEVDSGNGTTYWSKADFSLPEIPTAKN
ncbi:hypothetical protein [Reinekea sp. G2M2-21]|uniref:hypothetical protein n=1 Tax=Reinekea sp. G2M2-21 TaxID=2788942 RepID=UPI0018A95D38|nr:hypothetical protein [Reinekea sp. G2M2-21]